jgi:hypothetical protein
MNRGDMLFVGLGGAGGRLVDNLMDYDGMYQGFFINTSIGDIKSLTNSTEETHNYYCISTLNGVGRNRKLGKAFADQSGYNMIDILTKYQQEVIYLVASLGGGSGSSILSVLLEAIEELKSDEDGSFNKIINVIAILPSLNSPDVILNNALETWDEIIDNKGINGIMFIDNGSNIIKAKNIPESQRDTIINSNFIELFDSIFDIPENNSIRFDNGNLGNILRDKGCLYIYDIPNDCTSIDIAMSKSEANSVFAKMYKEDNIVTESNKLIQKDNSENNYIECGYLGMSFLNQTYNKDYFYQKFSFREEDYDGVNANKNLFLISGCKPPINSMKLIQHEIKDRKKNGNTHTKSDNNSSFKINKETNENNNYTSETNENNASDGNANLVKKAMKKNLFRKKR